MSKKKKVAPVVRPPTKRQLTRWQKQERQQKIIYGIGAVIIAAVVILIGSGVYFGWYVPVQLPLRETVLEVRDSKLPMSYYVDTAKYQLNYLVNGALGGLWSYAYYFGYLDYIYDYIRTAEVMRLAAKEMGIVVSEAEIDEQLRGHPDSKNRALRGIVYTSLLSQKLSDEYFAPQLPLNPEQRRIKAMLLESQAQLDDVKARIEAGEDFGTLAEEFSLNAFTKGMKGDLGFRPREVIVPLLGYELLETVIFEQGVGTMSQVYDMDVSKPVGYWLVKVIEMDEDEERARISSMLLGSEEEALEVLARLEDGEEFVVLAEEFSQVWDANNPEVWFYIDDEKTEVVAFVFDEDTEIGDVSIPIQDTEEATTGGYWLIEVTASENRPISDENHAIMIDGLFSDWLDEIKENAQDDVVNYFDDERALWVVDYFTGGLT